MLQTVSWNWSCGIVRFADSATVLQDELETAMRLCGVTDLERARGDLSYLNTKELEQLLPPKPLVNSWFSFGSRTSKL